MLTKREVMDRHRSDPACASCHALFDPIGYAFENFDWIGANRSLDNGRPVDSSGKFETFDFKNSKDLVGYLKGIPDTQRCLVSNLFRVAIGHIESQSDQAIIDGWNKELANQKRMLPGFFTQMLSSDGFRYVSVPDSGP